MIRNSFVFYRSYMEAADELDPHYRTELYEVIVSYGLSGVVPNKLDPYIKALFKLIKPQIDANNKKYENGKRGGRPSEKNLPCSKEEFIACDDFPEEWISYEFPKSWREMRLARITKSVEKSVNKHMNNNQDKTKK